VLLDSSPDLLLVVGDVNSTVASALTAAKLEIPVAHVEAGLRSFDRTMPEEINRVVTDALSSLLFVTEQSGLTNLLREGVPRNRIHLVGNVMIDALEMLRPRWSNSAIFDRLGLHGRQYAVLTLHRPSNVDRPETLDNLLDAIRRIALHMPVVFPVHPRSRGPLSTQADLSWRASNAEEDIPTRGVTCLEPLGYLDFVALMSRAAIVLTDSGGIQEETTVLGVPCLTLRDNTERPITVTHGTNRIVGRDPIRIVEGALSVLAAPPPSRARPPLWDGSAASRIIRVLLDQPEIDRVQCASSLEIGLDPQSR
jgi:UDP-N-acetylglucosamine 2-epimerase (non-hydrolysing)